MPVDAEPATVVRLAAADQMRRHWWSGTWLGPRLVPVVIGLLLLAALVGAMVGGSLILRSDPISITPPSAAPTGPASPAPSRIVSPLADGPVSITETGAMLTPRARHAAVRLLDGRVLVVGGTAIGPPGPRDPLTGAWPTGMLATAELWDPATGRFSQVGSMTTAREFTTATLLDDGRVLIAGGSWDSHGLEIAPASAELFDPATATFSATGSMPYGRGFCHCGPTKPGLSRPSATRLLDGRVFIAGGHRQATDPDADPPDNRADIYDPTSGTFSQSPLIPCDTTRSTVTALLDGRVLVVCISDAVVWDPSSNRFAPAGGPRMTYPGDATRLPDGRVLLTAPIQAGMAPPPEIYDPATGTFQLLADVANPGRMRFVLPDGRLLLAPDSFFATDGATEVVDPTTGASTALESPVAIRGGFSSTLLPDGRVLIAGGDREDADALSSLLVEPARRP
jgi:hypothetical protein